MGKKLVIVESPAKARTITRILGDDFVITASMGHIRDLPEKSLGIDIENNFEPMYVETRKSLIKELVAAAKGATDIYLAPDPDREGEAIAWHLQELLSKKSKAEFHRVAFHEITKSAVNKAFETPGEINSDLVDAQQARRVLDRLVGYQVSPLLWSKVKRGASAGRVQSVALRMVCEREREILAFKPEEYWLFDIDFEPAKSPGKENRFGARLIKIDGKKAEVGNGKDAEALLTSLKAVDNYAVSNIEVKPQFRNAPPPFITSTLQQAAGSSASQTMRIAQQLYEGIDIGSGGPTGLITYMRTDSFAVAKEAQEACREFIGVQFGSEYVPGKPNFYKSKSGAQGAHEAIRPTDVNLTPEQAEKFLDPSQLRLYTIIWKRFVSSQMSKAKLQKTTVDISDSNNKYIFRSVAIVTLFPGFTIFATSKDGGDEKEKALQILGDLSEGDKCNPIDIVNEQKFTEPAPRFSEASLIRELEANGIGRPSTYATIVRTIQTRTYCDRLDKGKLAPTELGFSVNDYLVEKLPSLFEISFTSDMENKLDEIEDGKLPWKQMLSDFYGNMSTWLKDAKFAGAPENEKSDALFLIMEGIKEWKEPVKIGKRTYDDSKFFESLKGQYEKNSGLTEKQWGAMLNVAITYKSQLPTFDAFVKEFSCESDVKVVEEAIAERAVKEVEREKVLNSDAFKDMQEAFSMFDDIEWDEPVTRRGRTYDDSKFFKSLQKQVEVGRVLSVKQVAAMKRIASKYVEKVPDPKKLTKLLELDKEADPAEKGAGKPEIDAALAKLAQVTEWKEPVTKGKRVFDDKEFYSSLQTQYNERRELSTRQEYALKKLLSKYE